MSMIQARRGHDTGEIVAPPDEALLDFVESNRFATVPATDRELQPRSFH